MNTLSLVFAVLQVINPAAREPATQPAREAREVRVAVGQILGIDSDREGNFQRMTHALEQAVADKADIVCFPESIILGWENPDAHQLATPIPGADSDRICALAKRFNVMILIGLDEKDGDKLYDSAILVDRDGKILLKHRKINVLPELMTPPYSTGRTEDISAVETRFGRIGVMICADTFTDNNRLRMQALKPELALVPYGWAAKSSEWPGHAKGLEKLVCKLGRMWSCPVVGVDLVGAMSQGPWRGRTYGGASIVADAQGNTVALLKDRDVEVRTITLKVGG